MSKPEERPTFKIAHMLRCHGIISRDAFLAFEKDFGVMVNTIVNSSGEDLWQYVNSLFALDDYSDCVPINSANFAITWDPVIRCLNSMTLDWNRDVSIQKRENVFGPIINAARDLIAKQLNVSSNEIALLRGASEANSVIHGGQDFNGARNEVVIWIENHPTNDPKAWGMRQLRFTNMKIVTVDTTGESLEDAQHIVDMFLKKIKPGKTLLVSFSEISHLTGARLPAKELCEQIHSKDNNIHVHVDGAQAWGSIKENLRVMGCDSFCGSGHKWILGPKETGFLYMKKDRIPNFWPKDVGYNAYPYDHPSSRLKGKVQPPIELPTDASRFEMLGQRNDISLMGLLYTADLMGLIGFENIEARDKVLSTRLRDGLQKVPAIRPWFRLETPTTDARYHAIITLQFFDDGYLPSKPDDPISVAVYNTMYEDHKIAVSTKKGNRMRIAPHIHNSEAHIDRFVETFHSILAHARHRTPNQKQ